MHRDSRTRVLSILAGVLLLAGACSGADEGDETDELRGEGGGSGSETVDTADMQTCENPEAGYEISYPADWHTMEGTEPDPGTGDAPQQQQQMGIPGCSLFNPEPVETDPETGMPPQDLAVMVFVEQVPFEQVTEAEADENEIARDEVAVAGFDAVRIEMETPPNEMAPEGGRSYGYLVDLGERTLIAATSDGGGAEEYERNQAVLDEMIQTLEV